MKFAPAAAGGGGGAATWGGITGTLANQTDLNSVLGGKVDANAAVVGAIATKITFDAKGLVTSGDTATTADIADSSDKRYVTDAELVVLAATSGVNSGDQSSVTGNAGSATVLQTPRRINGVLFDGSADISTDVGPSAAAETIYVAIGGSDANPGTALLPKATVQGALDGALHRRLHPITIQLGAGSFAGATIEGFSFRAADPAVGSYLTVLGTMVTATLATGSPTGTTTSASSPVGGGGQHTQVIDATQAWTPGDLVGKRVLITSGALAGTSLPIEENDATTLTFPRVSTLALGVTYTIQAYATNITSGPVAPKPSADVAVGTTQCGFLFGANLLPVGNNGAYAVAVDSLNITTPVGAFFGTVGRVRNCRVAATSTSTFLLSYTATGAAIAGCDVPIIANGTVLATSLGISGPQVINSGSNSYRGVGSGRVFFCNSPLTQLYVSLDHASNLRTGYQAYYGYVASTRFVNISVDAVSAPSGVSVVTGSISSAAGQLSGQFNGFFSCGCAVRLSGGIRGQWQNSGGSGNTVGVAVSNGAVVELSADWAVAATTDLQLDGQSETLTNLRTFTPVFWNNPFTGSMIHQGDSTSWSRPDASGTPGNATQHTVSGRVAIAGGATTVTVNNNRIKAGSDVHITWLGDTGAARWWKDATVGSVTVTLSSPAAGATSLQWDLANT